MSILLQDWSRPDHYWLLDVSSGTARAADRGLFHGFLFTPPGNDRVPGPPRVAAVYGEDGKLWFQADEQRWEAEEVDFGHKLIRDGGSQFTVSRHGETVLDVMYLGPELDLTFDVRDLEFQDLFYFLARNGRDPTWRADTLRAWDKGISE